MGKGKKRSLEERLKDSTQNNQKWLGEYIESIKGTGYEKQSPSAVIRLIESVNHKDLNEIAFDEVFAYLNSKTAPSTFNTQLMYLKSFYNFLLTKEKMAFEVDKLNTIIFSRKDIDETKRDAFPLSFEEIIKLRRILEEKQMYTAWFIFEVIYQYDVQSLSDVCKFIQPKYDPEKKMFNIKNYNETPIPTTLLELIEVKGAMPVKKKDTGWIYFHLKNIEKVIGRPVISKDIIATRKLNFMKCPRCQREFEANPENWAVYQYEEDDSKYIVCKAICYEGVMNRIEQTQSI